MEQLSTQSDGVVKLIPRMVGRTKANIRSDTSSSTISENAEMLLQALQQLDLEYPERRRKRIEQQRALWESTLPRYSSGHIGHFPSGPGVDDDHPEEVP